MKSSRPATIYDVAERAGVSHQTVALYLRGHQGFRPATRERVAEALRELDYRPNLAAKALATATSHRIGALTYALEEVGPNATVQGASERARQRGYVLDLVTLDPTEDAAVERALGMLGQQSLAGILAFAPIDLIATQIERIPFAVPVLAEGAADPARAEPGLSNIGLELIVDHLVSLGHRRFFHIAGPPSWAASVEREAAYTTALARHGLVSLGSAPADWKAAAGYAAASALDLGLGMTAIVAASDQIALGAMLALSQRGVRVPSDISVTGFDDLPEAAFYNPPLTTVKVDYAQQGRMLVDRLLALIEPGVSELGLINQGASQPGLVEPGAIDQGAVGLSAKLSYAQSYPTLVTRQSSAPPPG